MKHEVNLTHEAQNQLRALPRAAAAEILAAFRAHLVNEPRRESKSRIKFLRGKEGSPQYRLRVGAYRAYYDVADEIAATAASEAVPATVTVLAILPKDQTYTYLEGRK